MERLEKIEEAFCEHRAVIRAYLINLLKDYTNEDFQAEHLHQLVKEVPYLMVGYIVNEDCIQESPNYYKDHVDTEKQGMNRRAFLRFISAKRDRFFMSDPYYNETSGEIYVLLYYELDNQTAFLNFDITAVLDHLGFGI